MDRNFQGFHWRSRSSGEMRILGNCLFLLIYMLIHFFDKKSNYFRFWGFPILDSVGQDDIGDVELNEEGAYGWRMILKEPNTSYHYVFLNLSNLFRLIITFLSSRSNPISSNIHSSINTFNI